MLCHPFCDKDRKLARMPDFNLGKHVYMKQAKTSFTHTFAPKQITRKLSARPASTTRFGFFQRRPRAPSFRTKFIFSDETLHAIILQAMTYVPRLSPHIRIDLVQLLCADALTSTPPRHMRTNSFPASAPQERQSGLRTLSTTNCRNVSDFLFISISFYARLPPHSGTLARPVVPHAKKQEHIPQQCTWCQGDSPCMSLRAQTASQFRRRGKDTAEPRTQSTTDCRHDFICDQRNK